MLSVALNFNNAAIIVLVLNITISQLPGEFDFRAKRFAMHDTLVWQRYYKKVSQLVSNKINFIIIFQHLFCSTINSTLVRFPLCDPRETEVLTLFVCILVV